MAIFDRQYMKDMRAILDKASVLKVEPKQSIEPVKVEAVAPSNQATNAVNCYQQTLQQLANRRDGLGNYNQLANLNNQRAAGLNSGRTLLDLYSGSQIGINR